MHIFAPCFIVDHLAHVYESLRSDLKSDEGKKLFMYYQATPVILTHLKVQSKVSKRLIIKAHTDI